jgi:hypothetical protein
MRTLPAIAGTLAVVGAVALGSVAPAAAWSRHHRTWNGCPPGWTVQGGNCAPYRGHGGGWPTWNGCPPGWTIQGGNCAPYRWGR